MDSLFEKLNKKELDIFTNSRIRNKQGEWIKRGVYKMFRILIHRMGGIFVIWGGAWSFKQ